MAKKDKKEQTKATGKEAHKKSAEYLRKGAKMRRRVDKSHPCRVFGTQREECV